MSSRTAPRFSTRELQAAAAALEAGRFSSTISHTETTAAVAERTQPVRDERDVTIGSARFPTTTSTVSPGSTPLVRVRAANAGAGASTIALALADVADVAGIRTRVLDAAAPVWSGLLGATVTELGAAEGWRRGRRGDGVLLDRVEKSVQVPSQVPSPRYVDGVDLTVLDAGWSMRELAAATTAWVATTPAQVEVLVTRPHGLALSQIEAALTHLEDHLNADRVVVVVVGASRWSDRKFATAGHLLRTLHLKEGVLFAPLLPVKALPGLGPDPLPTQLTTHAQRLLERITTITGPLTANRTCNTRRDT